MKNSVKEMVKIVFYYLMIILLLLEMGWTFGNYFGEICFNTSITGYQKILTDPSYYNQIINFTFPHIGIVGTNIEDYESDKFLLRDA